MADSILNSVKDFLNLSSEDDSFDGPVKMYVNAALSILRQNGIGNSVLVIDEKQSWDDVKDQTQVNGNEIFQMVPNYVDLYVMIQFDPPAASQLAQLKGQRDELLWRLTVEYDLDHPNGATDSGSPIDTSKFATKAE